MDCTECARPKRSFPVSLQQAKGIRSIPDGDVNRYYLVWWPDPLWGIIELRPGAAWKFKFMLVICQSSSSAFGGLRVAHSFGGGTMQRSKISAYQAFHAAENSAPPLPKKRATSVSTAQTPQFGQRGIVARKQCSCGRCRECVDNARWERIFLEKFALKEPDVRGMYRSPISDF